METTIITLIKEKSKYLYFNKKAMEYLKLNPKHCKVGIKLTKNKDTNEYLIFIFVTDLDKYTFVGSNGKSITLPTAKINLSTQKAISKHLYDLIYSHSNESTRFFITDTYESDTKDIVYRLETEQEYTKLKEITSTLKDNIEVEILNKN
jgi:hypothetical protein